MPVLNGDGGMHYGGLTRRLEPTWLDGGKTMNHHPIKRHRNLILATTVALALATEVAAAQPSTMPACASTGDAAVATLSRNWLLVGWERKAGDGPLNFREKLGRFYDWSSPDVVLYDDFDPQHRVVRSPADYGAIWEPGFSALNTAHHRLLSDPFVIASSDLAVATFGWAARLEGGDGKVTGIRSFSTLAWRCTGDGWKIVREHNSSVVLPTGQVDAVMAAGRD